MKSDPQEEISYPIRINRYLAIMNYATRRGADELIQNGKVLINGTKAKLGDKINQGDNVTVSGHKQKNYVYYAYYKPRGIITIGAQEGEKEIADVAKFPEKVFPIGRLDKESEGLIVMTNDGRITEKFLSPKFEHEKEYRITVDRKLTHEGMVKLRDGIVIDVGPKKYKTKKAKVRKVDNFTFDIVITEGKNRQIRKMCGGIGYKVERLKRFRVMNIELGSLKPGQWKNIEIEV